MKKRLLFITLALSLVLSACQSEPATSDEGDAGEAGTAKYTAGTYTEVASGFGGDVTVEVAFSDTEITGVTVLEHGETAGISDAALEQVPTAIVEAQGTEVDVAAGATLTSNAIIEATTKAINKAMGVEVEAAAVADGTYEGSSKGKNGEVKVAVTIKDEKIESVEVLEHVETIGFEGAFDIVEADMIATNSFAVDTVVSATMSSGAMIRATEAALKTAGFDESFKTPTGEVVRPELNDSYDAQVVVIGAGGAGITAAIQASLDGASVIVIDKAMIPGGNTKLADGVLNASGTSFQADEAIEDTNESFFDDTMIGGDNVANPDLVKVLTDNSADSVHFLRDVVGVEWAYLNLAGGHSVTRSHYAAGEGAQLFDTMYDFAVAQGAEVMFDTTATEIMTNDAGVVTGVKATNNGKEVIFNASQGVILATGGYGQNADIIKMYDDTYVDGTICTNSILATGDGILLAQGVGANLVGMEYTQKHPTANAVTGDLLSSANSGRGLGTTILVNKEGNRFVEELERRDVISNTTAMQTGGVSYSFFTQTAGDETEFFDKFGDEIDSLLAEGQAVKADTIAEACAFFEIDEAQFMATLERYNTFAQNGVDEDFNRRSGLREYSTTEGPFYFIKSAPAVHHTMGGVEINVDTQVIDTEGNVIENLYAAGEVTGGIHGSNRLGGNAITDLSVFGRIAGSQAANNK